MFANALVAFLTNATVVLSQVHLQWQTSNEVDCSAYEIQSSKDGITYTSISKLNFRNQRTTQTYNFTHNNPDKGTIYYRLKQIDKNAGINYGPVRKVNIGTSGTLRAYPNPVRDRLLLANVPDNSDLRLYDAVGRMVLQLRSAASTTSVSVQHLPAGLYELHITTPVGDRLLQKVQVVK